MPTEFANEAGLSFRTDDGKSISLLSSSAKAHESATAVVVRVRDVDFGEYALKYYRAAETPPPGVDLEDLKVNCLLIRDREIAVLSDVNHACVTQLVAFGTVSYARESDADTEEGPDGDDLPGFPAILLRFEEGMRLDEWLRQSPDFFSVMRVLEGVASALDAVHGVGALHLDIAMRNIIVRLDGTPCLLDFGMAKVTTSPQTHIDITTLFSNRQATLERLPRNHPLRSKNVTYEELKRWGLPGLDVLAFSDLMRELLEGRTDGDVRSVRYIQSLVAQAGEWASASQFKVGDLGQFVQRWRRDGERLEELAPPTRNTRSVHLPLAAVAPLTSRMEHLVESPVFFRLAHLRQLMLVDYIYPGATHSRRLHLLHSYEMARQLTSQLLDSPYFQQYMGQDDILRLLSVALLHDLNHFPFLHNVQEAIGEGLSNSDAMEAVLQPEHYGPGATKAADFRNHLNDVGLDLDSLKHLCFAPHDEQLTPQNQIISSIVNSGVDVDKLSYLVLDGQFTGVAYARGLDIPTLFSSASILQLPNGRLHLAFSDRALQAVEHVFLTRLWNFRAIYWHHTNRSLMAMVGRAIRTAFATGNPKDTFGEFFRATISTGEAGALDWLGARCRDLSENGAAALVENLPLDRTCLYKRLYVVRPEDDPDDAALFDKFSDRLRPLTGRAYLDADVALCGAIAVGFGDLLRSMRIDAPVSGDDILVDVPRRKLDTGGEAYVASEKGPVPLTQASSVIGHIHEDYDKIAKRVRVFMSPRLANALPRSFRWEHRREIAEIVRAAADGLPKPPKPVS